MHALVEIRGAPTAGALNRVTHSTTVTAGELWWEGPAGFFSMASSRTVEQGGATVQADAVGLRLPLDCPVPPPGAEVVVRDAPDSTLVEAGKVYRVVRALPRTGAPARRFELAASGRFDEENA